MRELYPDELEALLQAYEKGKSVYICRGVDNATNIRRRLEMRVGTDNGWRLYARKTEKEDETWIYIFSPKCDDPEPPRTWNGPHKASYKQSQREKEKKQKKKTANDYVSPWVLKNLIDPGKLHITVVPWNDIQKLGSVGKFETYMTNEVQKAMGRNDVRVMVREEQKDQTAKDPAYNARVIFLEGRSHD